MKNKQRLRIYKRRKETEKNITTKVRYNPGGDIIKDIHLTIPKTRI